MEYITHNLKETYGLAAKFVAGDLPSAYKVKKAATVVGLFGELGAGKTSFAQGIARAFGVKDYITSPTFVLEKIYKLSKKYKYERLIHIDAYRLHNGEEMRALGWWELLEDSKNIIFIEWPERVESVLPKEMIKIYFDHSENENERRIKIMC
ncbi:MAG: tRNA (adenosine(37)-N6)-threonylcarbamoyltransferase complex ATPase subunit type 1 TsaE [Candidatus Vogelbacteria bacterium]|nr:tRNA (adenosine(37)-N6)-threonylcarbamoyltransferase complex ATPase subunit type 1 TsaE [Candidatus Vogelbacteria bacterium]